MLDLYKLQIFSVVMQEGSFSAAAARLYITQSAVSQHMKELELGLGRQLFHRGARGVKPTAYGEILYANAREIFALVAKTENALTDVTQLSSGRVAIGATPGIAMYVAPDWVQMFRTEYARLSVALTTGITSQVIRDALTQQIDLGFIEGELDGAQPARLDWIELSEIEQKVVVGFRHPWWSRTHVRIEELHQQMFVMRPLNSQSRIWLDKSLRNYGVEPRISAEFDNIESMKRAVAVGACLAILPDYVTLNEVTHGQLHSIPIKDSPFRRVLKLVWDKEVYFSPITTAFLTVLSREYPALAGLVAGRKTAMPEALSQPLSF